MTTMYDSVTPGAIPTNATIVAGYDNGSYAWRSGDWARFPAALKVHISVTANQANSNTGQVLDVEQGDARPEDAPGWVLRRRAAHQTRPTVYCNESTWPAVRNAFHVAQVPEPDYWIAHWTGQPHSITGAVAVQYADQSLIEGQPNYDLSVVTDGAWPNLAPPGPPGPPPGPVPAFPGYVQQGSSGAAVEAVQARLRERGWAIAVDGIFGAQTNRVVVAFQHEKGLLPDGIVGPNTWDALWLAPVTR